MNCRVGPLALRKANGSVLIIALWSLSFLTILVLQMASGIRLKMKLIERVEHKNQLRHSAEAGVLKTIHVLNWDYLKTEGQTTVNGKVLRHNNPELFQHQEIGNGFFDVHYDGQDNRGNKIFYGCVDEERKLNLNRADPPALKILLEKIFNVDEKSAQSLADAIIDWRRFAEGEIAGFYSDEFYENLEFPYEPKKGDYEVLEELFSVKGITPEIYRILTEFVTIYGDGRVNINTAPFEVLIAQGLSEDLVKKILSVRRGKDQEDSTPDDYVFQDNFLIASNLSQFVEVSQEESKQLEEMSINGLIGTSSYFYKIKSEGKFSFDKGFKTIACVYSPGEQRVVYWRED